jgi:hypothetical protein
MEDLVRLVAYRLICGFLIVYLVYLKKQAVSEQFVFSNLINRACMREQGKAKYQNYASEIFKDIIFRKQ